MTDACPICLDGDSKTSINFICGHSVCEHCLGKMFLYNVTLCPVCRAIAIIQKKKSKREFRRDIDKNKKAKKAHGKGNG